MSGKELREIAAGGRIVAMIEHQGRVWIATGHRVYRENPETRLFEPVMFVADPPDPFGAGSAHEAHEQSLDAPMANASKAAWQD